MATHKAPFGHWKSPLIPERMAEQMRLIDVQWDTDGDTLVWLEQRSGRGVLCCASPHDPAPRDLTDIHSVRAQVGYGGGEFAVAKGHAYFVAPAQPGVAADRLYRVPLSGGMPVPLTPEFGHAASPAVSPDGRHVLYVHTYEGRDSLACVDADGARWPHKIVTGDDFYMQPRWHPTGDCIAWIAWNHPNMPWDGTWLRLATFDPARGQISAVQTLAGGDDEAVFQPEFSPDGRYLAYISNANGWGNLYLYDLGQGTHRALLVGEVELSAPAWVQGLRTFGFSHDGKGIYAVVNTRGYHSLWYVELPQAVEADVPVRFECADRPDGTRAVTPVPGHRARRLTQGLASYTAIHQLTPSPTDRAVAFIGSSDVTPPRVVVVPTGAKNEKPTSLVLRRSGSESIRPEALSPARPLVWQAADGTPVHGLYHAPAVQSALPAPHPGEPAPSDTSRERPPTILLVHGGPTDQALAAYDVRTQFFTTRGYAVLRVNYRGSSGYGKAYVDALRGHWGVRDVEDVHAGARHLVDAGLADPKRLVVMGSSAGGFTVLRSLIMYPNFYRAGVSLYGIANLFTLASDTHKFEAHYLDRLIGPLPQARARYQERSPLFEAEKIQVPVAIFHGSADRVVPPDQAEAIVQALRRRGVPHVYHLYDGEGHGWRRTETITAFYRHLEDFLRQYVLY